MREIDEVAEASSERDEGNSSPAVTIHPEDPRAGPLSPGLSARSPPASFEDFIEETDTAALTEVVRRSAASPAVTDPLPQPVGGPPTQHGTSSLKQKGKRVTSETDEGPEHKRLQALRDNKSMVGRILAMAKVYASPSGRNPTITTSPPGLVASMHSCSEAGPTTGADSVGREEVLPSKSLTSSSLGEDQDNFSQEFNRLQEEVASEREALEQASSVPVLPTRPESLAPVSARAVPRTSTSAPPTTPLQTGQRSNFQTEGLIGCPLEALSSLVTPEHIPHFGQLPGEDYAEQLTRKILQEHNLIIPI
jgi:hypothetical protein